MDFSENSVKRKLKKIPKNTRVLINNLENQQKNHEEPSRPQGEHFPSNFHIFCQSILHEHCWMINFTVIFTQQNAQSQHKMK